MSRSVPFHALLRAYRATAYRVFLPTGVVVLRCGQRAPRLDGWLKAEGVARWCVLTAWNPASRRLDAAENRRRQEALRQRLRVYSDRLFRGENHADAQDWPVEETLFVPGLSRAAARGPMRGHGQNAFLWGVRGKPARLCWLAGGIRFRR